MSEKKTQKIAERIAEATDFGDISIGQGLTSEQVEIREKEGLQNKTRHQVTKTYWQIFCDNFFSVLNILLIVLFVAMVIAQLSFPHYFFMFVLVFNVGIGLFQDIRARRLCDKLRVITDPKAKVIRDGEEITIAVDEVVLSDILVLDPGDQICADCLVLRGNGGVDESIITGESNAVSKAVGDEAYSGTFVTKGHLYAQVIKVGNANYAESLKNTASTFTRPRSEIKKSITRLMWITCTISLLMGVAMTLTYLVQSAAWDGFSYEQYVSFVSSLSGSLVAMIPAGMFLMTSMALTVGVITLANKRMLVQQLYCIEMLARVDVLCFDKTGTLTDGALTLAKVLPLNGYNEDQIASMVSTILYHTNDTNPTANALRIAYGNSTDKLQTSVIPFDSSIKYSAVSILNDGTYLLGAYRFVPAKEDPAVKSLVEEYASKGYRVMVLVESKKQIGKKVPSDGITAAILLINDHIKEDAASNIAWFKQNGVDIRIISGDDPVTVSEIAKAVGVDKADSFISLEGKSLEECALLANEYTVFGRVSPEQKAALIAAYQAHGHKVAMTGDGVNDILALKIADCSVAMASGAEAARSISHLIALDNDFSRLPDVVAEGRRVINNLQRTCSLFLVKTFFAMIVSAIFLISQITGGLSYPFETSNLLVWEGLSIGVAGFLLALQPSHERTTGTFFKNIIKRILPGGIVACLAGLLPYLFMGVCPDWLVAESGNINEVTRTASVLLFTFVSFVALFRICWPFNRYRGITFGISLGLAVIVFVLDCFVFQGGFLSLQWEGLSQTFFAILVPAALISIGLYFLLDLFIKKVWKDQEEEVDENW